MAGNHYHTDGDTIDYDFENDSLYFFLKGANYLHSVNLDNVIIDFGDDNYVKGVEIQNASKRFGVSKSALMRTCQIDFHLDVSEEKIELNIQITLEIRNKFTPKSMIATDANEFHLPSGTIGMSCAVC
ncbi:hypothetical protein AZH53_03785 [Methanomicrobiaceae archaeon CYW5]|uniref:DUF2283 domain-containing protein n=1 Tax=Methanovulcanius yangii TaxID=1789227 RepID=UPI0029CA1B31|nr:DUF2283 domain-containing protein [Methanovulcanius yangii]MBT8507541.1 hypothetical protein [Methanovulcanius yangii]